jgi:hypothetical protein
MVFGILLNKQLIHREDSERPDLIWGALFGYTHGNGYSSNRSDLN